MGKRDYLFGVFLVFVGILFLLLNFKVITLEWLMFILSVGILIGYLFKRSIMHLVFGIILLGISSISILDKYVFEGIDVERFLFLTILGIVSLIFYAREKNKSLLAIGAMSMAFGLYNLLTEIVVRDIKWMLYLLFGISFYIMYLVGYRDSNSKWPREIGSVMIIISLVFLLTSQTMLKFPIWRYIFYILPVLLIVVGAIIIYDRRK
ncbi:MAG: hypothetical protein GX080_06065 [Tissierellia bacterium]|nr:hypothetical protein [Tissierellia bacterium]